MKARWSQGFTLIELLLVLVILAALATIVVPKFTKRSEQAKQTAAKADIANMEVALDAFEIDTSRYPTNSEGLRALMEKPANADGWRGPYLKKGTPRDPWGQEYIYRQPGQYNEYGYDLSSPGPDAQAGNDDDIINWSRENI
ncbi:MAG: type II secretion system major pseudopilin GspG [Planctomycetaceae bacterium]|nr:type II secretion system major pseudopilin GspG [Planctomycetaceae bacterium]